MAELHYSLRHSLITFPLITADSYLSRPSHPSMYPQLPGAIKFPWCANSLWGFLIQLKGSLRWTFTLWLWAIPLAQACYSNTLTQSPRFPPLRSSNLGKSRLISHCLTVSYNIIHSISPCCSTSHLMFSEIFRTSTQALFHQVKIFHRLCISCTSPQNSVWYLWILLH